MATRQRAGRAASLMRAVLLVGAVAALAGCTMAAWEQGTSDMAVRPAQDTPVQFVTTDGVVPEDACRGTMVDPRDQTMLRLARSFQEGPGYLGDYEVPQGRYGVRPGELLRLDCRTGDVIGIVRGGSG